MMGRPRGRGIRGVVAGCLALVLLASAGPALADNYEPKRAGHPLRIVAYVLHPIGVAIDYLVLRPAHWVGSREPFKTVFGHQNET